MKWAWFFSIRKYQGRQTKTIIPCHPPLYQPFALKMQPGLKIKKVEKLCHLSQTKKSVFFEFLLMKQPQVDLQNKLRNQGILLHYFSTFCLANAWLPKAFGKLSNVFGRRNPYVDALAFPKPKGPSTKSHGPAMEKWSGL